VAKQINFKEEGRRKKEEGRRKKEEGEHLTFAKKLVVGASRSLGI
jgi:hypothetical protein